MISRREFKICLFIAFGVLCAKALMELSEPKSKVDCVNDLVELCSRQNYLIIGDESLITFSFTDSKHDPLKELLCIRYSTGTNCTINGSPWLYCSADHKLFYKGKLLKKNSTENTDDEVCYPINLKIRIREEVDEYVEQIDNELKQFNSKLNENLEQLDENVSNLHAEIKNGVSSLKQNIKSQVREGLNKEKEILDKDLSRLHNNLNKLGDTLSQPCFPFCK